MKILVLGATGQIGFALTSALARTDHDVSVLVRRVSGQPFPDSVSVIEQPAFSAAVFSSALQGVDHVIYAIGLPEQFLFDDREFDQANCEILNVFLGAMLQSRVRSLTYLSTYEVFDVVDGVIRETHPVVDERSMTPYSQSKVRAYRKVEKFAQQNAIALTTIHPAAVYGGLNTGDGVTAYMEKIAMWKWWRVPFIHNGSFPVIHVDSLSELIIKTLDARGAFIASDAMTSLSEISRTMRKQARSYVPIVMPLAVVRVGVFVMEALARVIPVRPLTATVQVDFITRGWAPDATKASKYLNWAPMSLAEGTRRFLSKPRESHALTGFNHKQTEQPVDVFAAGA